MGNIRYMADHAGGGRYSVVNPVEVTQFWRPRSGFGQKKDYIDQEAGDQYETKVVQMIQVTVWLHTNEFIFGCFYKNEDGRSSGAKTELL